MARQAFSIRLNAHERNRYQALADARGVSLGEWIRDALSYKADKEEWAIAVTEKYRR